MERKEFLEITLMSVRLNMLTANNEIERAISTVHGVILEAFVINEHLDILDVEACMEDEVIQHIIEKSNEEIVHDLLEITKRLYIKQFFEEERECEYLI